MIASERRVNTNSPGAGGGGVAVVGSLGNGIGSRGGSSGVNQILSSGRAVKIYVIDPRKFQERLEKYVGGLKEVGGGVKKSSEDGGKKEETAEKRNILVDLTEGDDDVIIEEERLVAKKKGGGSKLSTIAPAPAISSANGKEKKEQTVLFPGGGGGAKEDGVFGNFRSLGNSENGKQEGSLVSAAKPKKSLKKKAAAKKKRKAPSSSNLNVRKGSKAEDKVEAELAFLRKETTTRTGRVSKSPAASASAAVGLGAAVIGSLGSVNSNVQGPSSPSGSLFTSSGPNSRVPSPSPSLGTVGSVCGGHIPEVPLKKKRVPPEMFRCVTCNKFYVGFAKFNAHFAKFPDHVKSDAKKGSKRKKLEEESAVQTTSIESTPCSSASTCASSIESVSSFGSRLPLQSTNSNAVGSNHLHSGPLEGANNFHSIIPIAQCSELSSLATSSVQGGQVRRLVNSSPSPIDPNSQSTRLLQISSSSELQVSSGYPFGVDPNRTSFLHSGSLPLQLHNLPESNSDSPGNLPSLNVNEDTLNGGVGGGREDFFLDFNPHISEISQIPSELLGQGSCSQQSFNSLENLLADSNSQPTRLSSPHPLEVANDGENANGPGLLGRNGSSENSDENRSTFFSLKDGDGGGSLVQNSSNDVNVSSYSGGEAAGSAVDEESRDLCINSGGNEVGSSGSGCGMSGQQQQQLSVGGMGQDAAAVRRKSIWEFVKEQIRLCGINQACGEISEMAEKLSKVARDKFYPIREEEIERLNGTPPIIQVETPFISHLLDLPFGTYIFKEDGGIRKVIPPPTPISAELSLTNGVEVDVDKFLSPDFDLISLPHLTNLDFASICNDH